VVLNICGLEILSQGVCEVKTVFKIILRCFLFSPFSFSQEYTVEFSRGFVMCANVTDDYRSRYEYPVVSHSHAIKRFAKNVK
jgi:hypothetical protein